MPMKSLLSKTSLVIATLLGVGTLLLSGTRASAQQAALPVQTAADKAGWTTALPEAFAQAKAEKKLVLIDFTGSDWCPACQTLHEQVFSQPEFQGYAKNHLVFVELDFPREKPLAVDIRKRNEGLAVKYGIEVFPTVIVLDATGKVLDLSEGYRPGGVEAFLNPIKALKG